MDGTRRGERRQAVREARWAGGCGHRAFGQDHRAREGNDGPAVGLHQARRSNRSCEKSTEESGASAERTAPRRGCAKNGDGKERGASSGEVEKAVAQNVTICGLRNNYVMAE